jgi:diphthine synthase
MPKSGLIFIGLGLYDEKDISLKAYDRIKECSKVFAEFYTAYLMGTTKKSLEKILGREIIILTRRETEKGEVILSAAEKEPVAFITCGDPFTATTHVDLRLRAIKRGIKTAVIHGSSIITAVPGLLGLQQYKFGRITTLPFREKDYFPISPYHVIRDNKEMGFHSLVLLDIQSETNQFMSASEGIELLLDMEHHCNENVILQDTLACVVARAGSMEPTICANTIQQLRKKDFGPPLHTIVIPGHLHFMEIEALHKLADLPPSLAEKIQKL